MTSLMNCRRSNRGSSVANSSANESATWRIARFGLLDGPGGTGSYPPMSDFGATLHVSDAGRALLSALPLPSGIYNVCRDGERVSSERFTQAAGWHPEQ